MTMVSDKTPNRLEHIFLKLKVTDEVKISGTMHYPFHSIEPFSEVSGTCRPQTKPDGTFMTLEFNWGPSDIFMVGFTHTDGFTRFRGKFFASEAATFAGREIEEAVVRLIPEPPDTGTGTGQQT
jgi:hypothetical protein